jgi:hypothetical protein
MKMSGEMKGRSLISLKKEFRGRHTEEFLTKQDLLKGDVCMELQL